MTTKRGAAAWTRAGIWADQTWSARPATMGCVVQFYFGEMAKWRPGSVLSWWFVRLLGFGRIECPWKFEDAVLLSEPQMSRGAGDLDNC